jgi:hypothetical protein
MEACARRCRLQHSAHGRHSILLDHWVGEQRRVIGRAIDVYCDDTATRHKASKLRATDATATAERVCRKPKLVLHHLSTAAHRIALQFLPQVGFRFGHRVHFSCMAASFARSSANTVGALIPSTS